MNKSFFFPTSSRKIKSHVVESQITLLVWPCLSLTEKQGTFNHMIIFNVSISKFYWLNFNFTFETFAETFLCLLVSGSAKKKKMQRHLKKNFRLMFHLIKKLLLSFRRFWNLISRRKSFTVLSTDVCIFSYFFFVLLY